MLFRSSPLASGFLTDGFDVDALDKDDFRRRHPFAQLDLTPLRNEVARIARSHRATSAQVAVAWVLSRPAVAGAIVGVRNEREAEQLPACAALLLEPDELDALEAAAP